MPRTPLPGPGTYTGRCGLKARSGDRAYVRIPRDRVTTFPTSHRLGALRHMRRALSLLDRNGLCMAAACLQHAIDAVEAEVVRPDGAGD